MSRALIGLGSNIGDRQATIEAALDCLRATNRMSVIARSEWHRTAPIGGPKGQDEFLNAAALVDYQGPAKSLLMILQEIEDKLGRLRGERWSARTLDLDLLLFGFERHRTVDLQVPHPRMAWRRFVLEPAVEIAPNMIHVDTGWSIRRLHRNLSPCWVCIEGASPEVLRRIADTCSAVLLDDSILPGTRAALSLESLEFTLQQVHHHWEQNPGRPVISAGWPDRWLPMTRSQCSRWPSLRVFWPQAENATDRAYLHWIAGLPDQGPSLILANDMSDEMMSEEVEAAVRSMV